jgi:hypothetical protein
MMMDNRFHLNYIEAREQNKMVENIIKSIASGVPPNSFGSLLILNKFYRLKSIKDK